jgi:hypothetical protein
MSAIGAMSVSADPRTMVFPDRRTATEVWTMEMTTRYLVGQALLVSESIRRPPR